MSTLKAIKKGFLQKGWAGQTISRAETAERLDPIIRQHIRVNRMYDAALLELSVETDELTAQQKTARAMVGKIAETIYSCGGVAYQGTDLEPQDFRSTESDEDIFRRLHLVETDLAELLKTESDIEHQIRTRAILAAVQDACTERTNTMVELAKSIRVFF